MVIGHGRENSSQRCQSGAAIEIRDEEAEAHQREEVAQAAAGLGDLQLVDAEIDDIALEEHADAGEPRMTATPMREERAAAAPRD